MFKAKTAFTMIELIFVIVIIGILLAVTIPRVMMTRDDAHIAKNIEYLTAIMAEISSYTVSHGGTTDDLTDMSPTLESLEHKGLVNVDEANKSVGITIGEQLNCFSIVIDSNDSAELLKTFFSSSDNRICYKVQELMKENKYTIILRGQLIHY